MKKEYILFSFITVDSEKQVCTIRPDSGKVKDRYILRRSYAECAGEIGNDFIVFSQQKPIFEVTFACDGQLYIFGTGRTRKSYQAIAPTQEEKQQFITALDKSLRDGLTRPQWTVPG